MSQLKVITLYSCCRMKEQQLSNSTQFGSGPVQSASDTCQLQKQILTSSILSSSVRCSPRMGENVGCSILPCSRLCSCSGPTTLPAREPSCNPFPFHLGNLCIGFYLGPGRRPCFPVIFSIFSGAEKWSSY